MKEFTEKGFTLVELMITVALIAIMALIAVPAFQRYAINANLKSAARDIASDFLLLKERAISGNTEYQIDFDAANDNYEIKKWDTGTSAFVSLAPAQVKGVKNFGQDINITSAVFGAGDKATFKTRGTVTPLGTVQLTNSRNSTAKITTNITGRTYVDFTMQ